MVSNNPRMVKMATIETEYMVAFLIPCARELLLFKKKDTVTGNIAYKQGCNTDINPHRNPSRNVPINERGTCFTWPVVSVCAKTTRAVMENNAVRNIFNLFISSKIKK